ncbi:MAG: M18 family aminopeptidase [Lachnospiraceae bacterium]|nr:M18 family aminopeptidase [Lachnospiraceae bacterium]
MYQKAAKELFAFIENSPSPFHVIDNMKRMLNEAGFIELRENDRWNLKKGNRYYVTRNDSSIIAFAIPDGTYGGFQMIASHSDSPTFRIKENGEMTVENLYTKLNVEKYGGMLMAPWFDRPLSIAGRVIVRDGNTIKKKLVSIDRDLVLIPNVAIHMNRDINHGYKYQPQIDMLPLFGESDKKGKLLRLIADQLGIDEDQIIGHELSLYNRMKGTIWGAEQEFISCTKLDDLECAYSSIKGLIHSKNEKNITVCCVFDNEEVGSSTKQGAASTFLRDTLTRINANLGYTREDYLSRLAGSFMLSADNGHAVHPNHPEKADPSNRPKMNGGILIKHSANQKYTTDAVSAAILRMICQKAKVPYQDFLNHSDIPGGSTLGNLSNMQVAVPTADLGVAQLSMHSPYETGGVKDVYYLEQMMKIFYNTEICLNEDGDFQMDV